MLSKPKINPKIIMTGGRENRRFVIEPHSPYYLHPSEGPNVMITVAVFNRKNYDLWEMGVRMTLKAKNRLGFIDGVLARRKAKRMESFQSGTHGRWPIECCARGCSMSLIQD